MSVADVQTEETPQVTAGVRPYTVMYVNEDLAMVMDHVHAASPQAAVKESGYEDAEADSDVVVIEGHVFDVLAGEREAPDVV